MREHDKTRSNPCTQEPVRAPGLGAAPGQPATQEHATKPAQGCAVTWVKARPRTRLAIEHAEHNQRGKLKKNKNREREKPTQVARPPPLPGTAEPPGPPVPQPPLTCPRCRRLLFLLLVPGPGPLPAATPRFGLGSPPSAPAPPSAALRGAAPAPSLPRRGGPDTRSRPGPARPLPARPGAEGRPPAGARGGGPAARSLRQASEMAAEGGVAPRPCHGRVVWMPVRR